MMRITQDTVGNDVVVLRIEGDLINDSDLPRLNTTVTGIIAMKRNSVVLNLGDVDHIEMAAIGMILYCASLLRNPGVEGDLHISNLPAKFIDILGVIERTTKLRLFDTEDAAVAAFQS